MAINGDTIKNALIYAVKRANTVGNSIAKDPNQLNIGSSFQRGEFPGSQYVNQDFKNAVGFLPNALAPMGKIVGGAEQGKPLDALQGGGDMLMGVSAASAINNLGRAAAPAAGQATAGQARNLFGQYAKQGAPMISQLRNQVMQSSASPAQAAIEKSLGAGDYQTALKLAQSIAQNDPYRNSMINMVSRFMQQ